MHCEMLEDQGWEDPNALWDAGGPGVGGPQCIVGCWRTPVHCGMLEDPGVGGPQCIVGCWRTLGWEDPSALWDAGGPWGGRTPMHCGMMEDPNALWDAGGPGVGGPQCIVGCWRTLGWEDPNALLGGGGGESLKKSLGLPQISKIWGDVPKIDSECPQNAFGGWVGVPSTPPPPLTPLPCPPPTPRDWCLSRQLWWGHRVPAYKVGLSPPGSDPPDEGLWVVARSEDEARDEAARLCCAPPGDVELQQGGGGGPKSSLHPPNISS